MKRELTEAAKAAKMIRAELKKAFPGITFRVRSDNFSMGDAVRISYVDGPKTDAVDEIVKKYQYGHFDGMTDMYEFSNDRSDIPQAKYVQVSHDFSAEAKAAAEKMIVDKYEIIDPVSNTEWRKYFGLPKDIVIYRALTGAL